MIINTIILENVPTTVKNTAKETGFTLTQLTQNGRKVLAMGVIALVALMVGRFVFEAAAGFWAAAHPAPPPPPTMRFGLLPALDFPASTAIIPRTYALELPVGTFPSFPDRAPVLLVTQPAVSLLDMENAKAVGSRLGYNTEPDQLTSEDVRWQGSGNLNTTLELNSRTRNFTFATDYFNRPELQLTGQLPSVFDAVQTMKSFLSNAQLLPADMTAAVGKTKLLQFVGGSLKEAVVPSDADVISVDLDRLPVDKKYQMYSDDATTGRISGMVAMVGGSPTVVKARKQYSTVDYSLGATYPLRSPAEAWQVLKNGAGYVAANQKADAAVIRSVELGYWDPSTAQPYLQPIYVFKGDNNFVGYVSAVTPAVQQPKVITTSPTTTKPSGSPTGI